MTLTNRKNIAQGIANVEIKTLPVAINGLRNRFPPQCDIGVSRRSLLCPWHGERVNQ